MRISDWSSDVCSSDLTYSLVIDDALIEAVEAHQQHNEEGDSVGDDDAPEERTERAQSSLPVREIQAQLRQGRSIEQIATAAGVKPSWVERFAPRSEEHTSELQSLMRISYAVFCLKKKIQTILRLAITYILNKT